MAETADSQRKEQLKEFQQNAHRLLSEDDRNYLHYTLKEYQTYKSVEKLVAGLKSCLDNPRKLDLLADIRNLIPSAHLSKFDSLAPYSEMARPFKPPNQVFTKRKNQSLPHSYENTELRSLARGSSPTNTAGSFKVITLTRTSTQESLGFKIKGGRESDSPLLISEVDDDSSAGKQGLKAGDQLIEVNGIDFEKIARSSAETLLKTLNKLKVVVKSSGFVSDMDLSNSWGHRNGKIVQNGSAESDSLQASSGSGGSLTLQHNSHLLNSADSRKVNLQLDVTPNGFIGFNLRGGSEYGLGLYVSGVDPGSPAEKAGFKVGDQIMEVNGKNFENLRHNEAVDFIKSQKRIMVTLKAVGRLPEAKHFQSQISWLYPDGTVVIEGRETHSRPLSAPLPAMSSLELSHSSTQFPDFENEIPIRDTPSPRRELRETGVQTPEPSPEQPQEVRDEVVLVQVTQEKELERTQSAKSLATSSTSSGGEFEKTSSVRSAYSFESVNSSREEGAKKMSVISMSKEEALLSGSDGELSDKHKVKKSKSFLQKHGDKIKSKLSFRKKSKPKVEESGGSTRQQMLLYIEEKAKKILVVDEYNAVIRHIKQYQEDSDVESLVKKLLAILDKPEKALLLRDIRTLILPYDLGRFDAMVSAHEKEALEYLSGCVPGSPTIIPTVDEKPKRQLVAAIQDSRGSFQLRTKEEVEKIKQEREEMNKKRAQTAWLGGSILERSTRSPAHNPNAIITLPPNYTVDTIPVKDANQAQTSTAPASFDVPVIQVNNSNESRLLKHDENDNEKPAKSQMLLVPDRVSMEYKDDENDVNIVSPKSPTGGLSVAVPSIAVSSEHPSVTILLSKKRTSLGISISGGKGSKTQPEVRVEKIFPGGAASDDGRLKSGDEILSVDGESLQDVTHAEAVDIIRRSYNNKSKDVMEIVVIPKQ